MKILVTFVIIVSMLFGSKQTKNDKIYIAKKIGKQIITKDGKDFESTLASIAETETNYRKVLGDCKKVKGNILLKSCSFGEYQIRLNTFREIYNKSKILRSKYKNLDVISDEYIINKLIIDFEFSSWVAGEYIRYNYNRALKMFKYKEVYRRAIGRYNGGWNNRKYYNKVRKNVRFLLKHGRFR